MGFSVIPNFMDSTALMAAAASVPPGEADPHKSQTEGERFKQTTDHSLMRTTHPFAFLASAPLLPPPVPLPQFPVALLLHSKER